ncbi:serine/threonine-protein kinase pim-3-like [Silurus meridionalis]|nr:serine/threonine-protein kinase pim-3-like [Silurus meridionalis]
MLTGRPSYIQLLDGMCHNLQKLLPSQRKRGGAVRSHDGVKTSERGVPPKLNKSWNKQRRKENEPWDSQSLPLEVVLMKIVCKPPRCPFVIELLEWFETDMAFIIIMEQPESCVTLLKYCSDLPIIMPEVQAKSIMRQLVKALHHCHTRGVFHRDIKLDNIILNTRTMQLKLIDFGFGYIRQNTTYTEYGDTPVTFPSEWITEDEKRLVSATVRELGLLLLGIFLGGAIIVFEEDLFGFEKHMSKAMNQLVSSCYNLNSRKNKVNHMKRKQGHGQNSEPEMMRQWTEQKHVKRQETGSRPLTSKAGTVLVENHLEAPCSFTVRESKKRKDHLNRKSINDHEELLAKKMMTETEQKHVKRRGTGSRPVKQIHIIKEVNSFFELYSTGAQLGRGAFSSVYAGVRISDGKEPCDRESFPLELAIMKLLCKQPRCPYVIELLEWFETDTAFILILERPEPCVTLFDYCRSLQNQVPDAQAQSIMQQLVKALRHCHDRGVFHRDMKLDNILSNIQTMEVKLIDFGFSFLRKDTTCTECDGSSSSSKDLRTRQACLRQPPGSLYEFA